jgi:hypothetical protein
MGGSRLPKTSSQTIRGKREHRLVAMQSWLGQVAVDDCDRPRGGWQSDQLR